MWKANWSFPLHQNILLLNINLILAFIINIISQLIELLNISPASIVRTNTKMHVVLYITIDTTIMKICLSVACVAQWVELVKLARYFLSAASLVRILYATFIILKTSVFIFIKFSPFSQYRFSLLFSLISSVTKTFSRQIRNTVLQLSPVTSSVCMRCGMRFPTM